MENTILNNTPVEGNYTSGSKFQNMMTQHGMKISVNEKVYSGRQTLDGRRSWEKKRDTILSNIAHEINIFSMRDSQSRKDYLVYWGNKHSLNKDKFFSHLEESNSIGEKHAYRRRVVKEEWSMKSEEDGFKTDGKTKKFKRVKDEFLGFEIDIMVGQLPLLGRILDTKINSETGDKEPIMKKLTDKDGNKLLDEDGKQRENYTWRNNTFRNSDGSFLNEEKLVTFLRGLKEIFEGDNFKEELLQIDRDMKNKAKSSKVSISEENVAYEDSDDLPSYEENVTEDSYNSASSFS
tara:strand:+ start:148 stop:1023 length:876 start_codon:yes stop_codon:yes gene_type:complete